MSPGTDTRRQALADPATAAAALRERIYATITGLVSVITLVGYAETTTALSAASSITLTMGALWVASFVADLVSHTHVHGEPRRWELRRMALVAGQILETALLPVVVVALAATGIWTVRTGLVIAAAVLVVAQGVLTVVAVRRTVLTRGRRFLIVAAEILLCLLVIGPTLVPH